MLTEKSVICHQATGISLLLVCVLHDRPPVDCLDEVMGYN